MKRMIGKPQLWAAMVLVVVVLSLTGIALADPAAPFNPGTTLGNWAKTNITALYAPVVGGLLLWFGLVKRNWQAVAVVVVAAGVAGLALYSTDTLRDKAEGIIKWLLNIG